jgi:hypothetical protein
MAINPEISPLLKMSLRQYSRCPLHLSGRRGHEYCLRRGSLSMKLAKESVPARKRVRPQYEPLRTGDVKHSLADISKAQACYSTIL